MRSTEFESKPNRMGRFKKDISSRVDAMAESLFASEEPLVVNPEDFPQPQRLVLEAMKVLGLGGITLLIPSKKSSLKDATDPKS